jgi:hypothetical protein
VAMTIFLMGLFFIALGGMIIALRHRIAINLPPPKRLRFRFDFRNFPLKDSPKSVAFLGMFYILLGLIGAVYYVLWLL